MLFLLLFVTCVACRTQKTLPERTYPESEAFYQKPPDVEKVVEKVVEAPGNEFRTAPTAGNPEVQDITETAAAAGSVRDAFFTFDAFTLDGDARAALDQTATWLRANPGVQVRVEGHCDERGTEQYNLALGDRRGATAADYLATLGVARERLATVSYGEERPFETGAHEDAWAKNRRAHIVVTTAPYPK